MTEKERGEYFDGGPGVGGGGGVAMYLLYFDRADRIRLKIKSSASM